MSIENNQEWPYLLAKHEDMLVKTLHYTPLQCGYTPLARPLKKYLKYGIVNIDKPVNPSSHEVVSWISEMFKLKTGHCGTLDPKVSGVLTVLFGRSTRLAKEQQTKGKEYICIVEFHQNIDEAKVKYAISKLKGQVLQRPPLMCAVKRDLRLRNIYSIDLVEVNEKTALIKVSCEAGTYIRTLCTHLGLLTGYGAHMQDLRRIRSGSIKENECYSMHDLLDAKFLLDKDESILRRIVKPLEYLLVGTKRIIVKDSCISAICYGGQLTIKGILKYDRNIGVSDQIVIISTKGEAVALAVAIVTSEEISCMDHGIVTKTRRVIMERKTYPRLWKLDPSKVEDSEDEKENE